MHENLKKHMAVAWDGNAQPVVVLTKSDLSLDVQERLEEVGAAAMGADSISDCSHEKEPGCAVRKAIEDGTISEGRLKNYWKLGREACYEG
jgi:ribosome biogenesis GTPase